MQTQMRSWTQRLLLGTHVSHFRNRTKLPTAPYPFRMVAKKHTAVVVACSDVQLRHPVYVLCHPVMRRPFNHVGVLVASEHLIRTRVLLDPIPCK